MADRYSFAMVDARGSAADIFRALKEEVGQVVRGMPLDNPVIEEALAPDLSIGAFGSESFGDVEIAVADGDAEPASGNGESSEDQPSERSAFGGSSQRR